MTASSNSDDENLFLIMPQVGRRQVVETHSSIEGMRNNSSDSSKPYKLSTTPSLPAQQPKKKQKSRTTIFRQKRKQLMRLLKAICVLLTLLPLPILAQQSEGPLSTQLATSVANLNSSHHQAQMDANLSSSSSYVISDPGPANDDPHAPVLEERSVMEPTEAMPTDYSRTQLADQFDHQMLLESMNPGEFGSLSSPMAAPMSDDPGPENNPHPTLIPMEDLNDEAVPISSGTSTSKRRQYIPPSSAMGPAGPAFAAPGGFLGGGGGLAFAPPLGPIGPVGTLCPSGGSPLPVECDPKRPWPQCPPQSYCYATNTVDIGPYFCCPIWSTYGAAWRPATPFYNYAPPPPPNWPEVMRGLAAQWPAAAVGLPPVKKNRKEPRFAEDEPEADFQPPTEDQKKIMSIMNDWIQRQEMIDAQEKGTEGMGRTLIDDQQPAIDDAEHQQLTKKSK